MRPPCVDPVTPGRSPGDVSGADAVGGLVGRNKGLVANGYAAGAVAGSGATGAIVGSQVEGDISGVFAGSTAELGGLTGAATGWAPTTPPVSQPLQFFCDSNGNGFIDPAERATENYIWDFGGPTDYPVIRCAARRP